MQESLNFLSEPDTDDGDAIPNEKFIERIPYSWSALDAQTVRMDSSSLCRVDPCRRRTWLLLDVLPTNQGFYVVEDEAYRFNIMPEGAYDVLIPPRLNFFEKMPVPPADIYGP
jgi:hypothetical protein